MIFDSIRRELVVFMGQHDDRYLSDMWLYDINSSTLSEICSDFSANGGPEPSFAQRAVVDPLLQEIYVLVHAH
jgi:Tol biopolymer transport system component